MKCPPATFLKCCLHYTIVSHIQQKSFRTTLTRTIQQLQTLTHNDDDDNDDDDNDNDTDNDNDSDSDN